MFSACLSCISPRLQTSLLSASNVGAQGPNHYVVCLTLLLLTLPLIVGKLYTGLLGEVESWEQLGNGGGTWGLWLAMPLLVQQEA